MTTHPIVSADQYRTFTSDMESATVTTELKNEAILRHNFFGLTMNFICPWCGFDRATTLQTCPTCKLKTCHKCKTTLWPRYTIDLNILDRPVLTKLPKFDSCCYCANVGLKYPEEANDRVRDWVYVHNDVKERYRHLAVISAAHLVNRSTKQMAVIVKKDGCFVEDRIVLKIQLSNSPHRILNESVADTIFHSQTIDDEYQVRRFIEHHDIDVELINHDIAKLLKIYYRPGIRYADQSCEMYGDMVHITLTYYTGTL